MRGTVTWNEKAAWQVQAELKCKLQRAVGIRMTGTTLAVGLFTMLLCMDSCMLQLCVTELSS